MSENAAMSKSTAPETPKPRLLYFADTMCSWCYGFAPQMSAVLAGLAGRVDLLLFTGGLRPYTTVPVDEQLRAYLSETYPRISALSGQPFTSPRSLQPGFVYDTEPASRAVVTMRGLAPEKAYAYMLAIQRAFYDAGEDITQGPVLGAQAEVFGVQSARFLAAFESAAMREETRGDFALAQRFGITGFPTLVLHHPGNGGQGELEIISQGFGEAGGILKKIEAALAGVSP